MSSRRRSCRPTAASTTFGVKPTRPETGFGYLKLDKDFGVGPIDVLEFIEKPDQEKAKEMILEEIFLWNAGIFIFNAKHLVEVYSIFQSEILDLVTTALNNAKADLGFLRLDSDSWEALPSISFDNAIMEQYSKIFSVPYDASWSDLGNWKAIWENMEKA